MGVLDGVHESNPNTDLNLYIRIHTQIFIKKSWKNVRFFFLELFEIYFFDLHEGLLLPYSNGTV